MGIVKTLPYMFANQNWKDISRVMEKGRLILLFPLGSTESHGPHSPLSTDVTISTEVCLRAAKKLCNKDYDAYVLPPLAYAVSECARRFPGTISISAEAETLLITDICLSLIKKGMTRICLFNSHFEPAHLKCIYNVIEKVEKSTGARILFTDITRKKYSSRLTEAFQKAETHADRYETSLIMAIDPALVNEERRKSLPYLPINLVDKIFKERLDEFADFGMPESYCGDPASASAEEGKELLERLSDFIIEDIDHLFAGKIQKIQRGLYGKQ